MPAGDIDRMPVERRRRLVRTAAAEFATAGYDAASLNRIIQACGLSKSSFYHVFASKQDLFTLVVADLASELADAVGAPEPDAFSADRFWPTIDALFDRLMLVLQADPAYAALGRMFYLSGTPDDAGSAVNQALASVESWVRRVLESGRQSAAVRDDLPVALQSRLVFSVLRALDEWSVRNIDSIPAQEWPNLMIAQKAALRRLLEPDV